MKGVIKKEQSNKCSVFKNKVFVITYGKYECLHKLITEVYAEID